MSILKFPNYMYEIVIQTGEEEVGTFTIANDGELQYLYMTMLIRGVSMLSSESVHLRAIRTLYPAIPIQSKSITVSDFASGTGSWIGNVRFDFSGQALTQNDTIKIYLGTENYTQVHNGVEIGAVLNYIDSSNGSFSVDSNRAAYLTIFNDR